MAQATNYRPALQIRSLTIEPPFALPLRPGVKVTLGAPKRGQPQMPETGVGNNS